MNEFLFSYGTLQLKKVQIESFGRPLEGTTDSLTGYKVEQVQITDEDVLNVSGKEFHPIAIPTNNQTDQIDGTLYQVSHEELLQADEYEVSDYTRVKEIFASGKSGWIYIQTKNQTD